MSTPRLAVLAIALGLVAGLGLSGCGDVSTVDYDYQRAVSDPLPVEVPRLGPGVVGVYGE